MASRAGDVGPPSYWLARFLFLRLLGLVYAVAFLVILYQWPPLLARGAFSPPASSSTRSQRSMAVPLDLPERAHPVLVFLKTVLFAGYLVLVECSLLIRYPSQDPPSSQVGPDLQRALAPRRRLSRARVHVSVDLSRSSVIISSLQTALLR